MNIGDRHIDLSHEDKIMFPQAGITKGDLIKYYLRISDHILPHLHDRPLTLQRFPDGIEKAGFYQKNRSDYFPAWIQSVEVAKEGGTIDHVLCNNKATLVYLANQACITMHTWLSRQDALRQPDKLVIDLDPPENRFDLVVKAARALRDLIENELTLRSFIMTTGSRGMHVVIPLEPAQPFDVVRKFARNICQLLARRNPETFTTEISKNKRKGRLFLDYVRNAYAQTAVAPYSVRTRENAPVATPLRWDELDKELSSQSYHLKNIFRRLSQIGEIWSGYFELRQSMTHAEERLNDLLTSS